MMFFIITYELSFVTNCYCDKTKNIVSKLYKTCKTGGGGPKTRNIDTGCRGRCPF